VTIAEMPCDNGTDRYEETNTDHWGINDEWNGTSSLPAIDPQNLLTISSHQFDELDRRLLFDISDDEVAFLNNLDLDEQALKKFPHCAYSSKPEGYEFKIWDKETMSEEDGPKEYFDNWDYRATEEPLNPQGTWVVNATDPSSEPGAQ